MDKEDYFMDRWQRKREIIDAKAVPCIISCIRGTSIQQIDFKDLSRERCWSCPKYLTCECDPTFLKSCSFCDEVILGGYLSLFEITETREVISECYFCNDSCLRAHLAQKKGQKTVQGVIS